MKLSPRLEQIDRLVSRRYEHIFDCCCDHGFLGQSLLQRQAADTVHFVDVVAPLMDQLQQRLSTEFSEYPMHSWQVDCQDVAELRLPEQGTTLVILAGVGGDLMIDLVRALVNSHPERSLEFILCPVYHTYKVRKAMAALGFGMVDESLIRDNGHSYEIMHLSNDLTASGVTPLSAVGCKMWDLSRPEHQRYLERTVSHYQQMAKGRHSEAKHILEQYQALLPISGLSMK